MDTLASWLWSLLGGCVYPLWLASGVLDYACHRRDRIETSSGSTEPLLHLVQALQIGAGALLVLLFALTPVVLVAVGFVALLHTATAYADIAWAAARRPIRPFEQFVHALLVGLPLVAFSLLLAIGWSGVDGAHRGGGLVLRAPPFPPAVIILVIVTGLAASVLPAILEWRRARRQQDPG